MSEATIRAEIKNILQGVSGIGVIHTRRRYSRSRSVFRQLMTSGGIVNGCMIFRQASTAERQELPHIDRHHHFKIIYYYDLDDENASEDTFQALMDAIFEAFKANYKLNGAAVNSGPIQIEDVDTDYLESEKEGIPGTVVHRGDLSIDVEERATYTP